MREVFTEIFRNCRWGGGSPSGPGSQPDVLGGYMCFLQEFVRRPGIHTVVDVGCGDWSFSQFIDWSGIEYFGIDVVPDVVQDLNREFGASNVHFVCMDALEGELPGADLCIAKDVLQHWSNENVSRFLARLSRFRYVILTNDIMCFSCFMPRGAGQGVEFIPNSDIEDGAYRPLRLTSEPFCVPARRVLLLRLQVNRLVFLKETLLLDCGRARFKSRTRPARIERSGLG